LSVLILELVREHGRITVAEAARVSGASLSSDKQPENPPTIKVRKVPGRMARRREGVARP